MTELPNKWIECLLGEISNVQTGPFGSQLHNEDYVEVGTPMITVEHIVNDKINHTTDVPKVSDEDKLRLSKYILNEGDIVFSRVGSVDRSAYVSSQEHGWMFSGRLLRVRGDSQSIDSHYLHYTLTKKSTKEYIKKIAVGATMPSINTSILSEVPLVIPPLPEQKSIANILSSFDEKIELLREQNETLETLAQSIFKEWFVNFNYPDATGDMVDSEFGEIPKGWRVGQLSEQVNITMGQSPKGYSYNEISDGMVFYQGRAEFQNRFPKRRLHTTEPKRIAEKFDVLMSVRAPVGDINVATEQCCIGRGLAAINSEHKSYALYQMKSLKKEFDTFESEGTVFGSINKKSLESIKVIIPPTDIVESYNSITQALDDKIYQNFSQIQTLIKTRDTLLPKLMSGEVRVN